MTSRTSNPRSRVAEANAASRMLRRPVPQLRTIDETAEVLNTSPRAVRRLIEAGALPVHRFGRLVRVSDDDLAAFLAASRSP
jgi:excisionase family DNA binding protein